eukprot:scaffold573280_cov19-Prasinocladus_malaysianus.AAC.1
MLVYSELRSDRVAATSPMAINRMEELPPQPDVSSLATALSSPSLYFVDMTMHYGMLTHVMHVSLFGSWCLARSRSAATVYFQSSINSMNDARMDESAVCVSSVVLVCTLVERMDWRRTNWTKILILMAVSYVNTDSLK